MENTIPNLCEFFNNSNEQLFHELYSLQKNSEKNKNNEKYQEFYHKFLDNCLNYFEESTKIGNETSPISPKRDKESSDNKLKFIVSKLIQIKESEIRIYLLRCVMEFFKYNLNEKFF